MNPRLLKENYPQLLEGMIKTEIYLKKTGIDHKLLELIKYRVSQINGCAFCLDMHHKEALALGESEQRLHTLVSWRECPYFSDEEKTALNFAETLTHIDTGEITDSLFESLKQHFTDDQIAALTLAVSQINGWNRINRTFGSIPGTYKLQTK